MLKLLGKLIITGSIEALTGLAIGGSKTDVAIGGIDNNVIKDAEGVPYIPGSSLKGKIRSLLELKEEKSKVCDCGNHSCKICTIFGTTARENEAGPTRLYVRDAYLNEKVKLQMERKEGRFEELELTYTEGKWENTINRLTSKAAHPRQQERVPAGAVFDFQMIYNILSIQDIEFFNEVMLSLELLEDDYLGGNGSRGYGRVQFQNLSILLKTIQDYEQGKEGVQIYTGSLDQFNPSQNIETLKKRIAGE